MSVKALGAKPLRAAIGSPTAAICRLWECSTFASGCRLVADAPLHVDTDHSWSDRRITLESEIIEWLNATYQMR
jgi:hypothetical protein